MFANGDRYKGEYKNSKFYGNGRYVWANGSHYEGMFCQGLKNGIGKWTAS